MSSEKAESCGILLAVWLEHPCPGFRFPAFSEDPNRIWPNVLSQDIGD